MALWTCGHNWVCNFLELLEFCEKDQGLNLLFDWLKDYINKVLIVSLRNTFVIFDYKKKINFWHFKSKHTASFIFIFNESIDKMISLNQSWVNSTAKMHRWKMIHKDSERFTSYYYFFNNSRLQWTFLFSL